MQSVREFECLDKNLFNCLVEGINKDNGELSESRIYLTEDQSLRVDPELRSSKYKTIENKELFDIVEKYLELINEKDKYYNFTLVRNNLTVIEYKEGDFFKDHSDFLSYTSNVITEFTMILCLDGDCEGGETALHINDNFTYKSEKSKTTGCSLIFRKDLHHEGCKVLKGHKKILTLNINGYEKTNGEIVVIKFKNSDGQFIIPKANILAIQSKLTNLINDNSMIQIIELNDLPDNELFNSYTHFEVIYKILMNSYIDFDDFEKYKDVIEYYNIDICNILIGTISPVDNSVKNVSFNDEIIIFDNENIKTYFTNIVKLKSLPYIPVKILFVEGNHSYGGGMEGDPTLHYKMQPIWCSAGDYNQILGYQKLKVIKPRFELFNNENQFNLNIRPLLDISKNDMRYFILNSEDNINHLKNYNKLIEFDNVEEEQEENDEFDQDVVLPLDEYKLYLRDEYVRLSADKIKNNKIISYVNGDDESGDCYSNSIINMNFKYGIPKIKNEDIIDMTHSNDHYDYLFENHVHFIAPINSKDDKGSFCLDKNNDMYLNRKHGKNLIEKIKSCNFFETIKTNIRNNKLNLYLPQQHNNFSHSFCNEEIYVKNTLLFVDCLIKVDNVDLNNDYEFNSDDDGYDIDISEDYRNSDSDYYKDSKDSDDSDNDDDNDSYEIIDDDSDDDDDDEKEMLQKIIEIIKNINTEKDTNSDDSDDENIIMKKVSELIKDMNTNKDTNSDDSSDFSDDSNNSSDSDGLSEKKKEMIDNVLTLINDMNRDKYINSDNSDASDSD